MLIFASSRPKSSYKARKNAVIYDAKRWSPSPLSHEMAFLGPDEPKMSILPQSGEGDIKKHRIFSMDRGHQVAKKTKIPHFHDRKKWWHSPLPCEIAICARGGDKKTRVLRWKTHLDFTTLARNAHFGPPEPQKRWFRVRVVKVFEETAVLHGSVVTFSGGVDRQASK